MGGGGGCVGGGGGGGASGWWMCWGEYCWRYSPGREGSNGALECCSVLGDHLSACVRTSGKARALLSDVEAVRDSVVCCACFGVSSAGLLRSCEIRGILVSKIVLASFVGWEDELIEGDGAGGCGRDCVVRVESVVLLAGQGGVVFAVVPELEEEGREEADDEVGHDTGVDLVGVHARGSEEDLEAEGDLEVRGDFARFGSCDDALLEDVLLVSDLTVDVFGRGDRGDGETPLDEETGSDLTFVTGK